MQSLAMIVLPQYCLIMGCDEWNIAVEVQTGAPLQKVNYLRIGRVRMTAYSCGISVRIRKKIDNFVKKLRFS